MIHRATHFVAIICATAILAACGGGSTHDADADTNADTSATAKQGCGPVLVHDNDWYTSGKTQPFLPGLDGLHYPITTTSDSAQRYFDQGLVLAYAFNHAEAARAFWQAAREDSLCAMAWWGFAYVLGPNYNAGMEPDSYSRAYDAIQKARSLSGTCTEKERGSIDAMALRYVAEAPEDRSALDKAYSDAMRKLAAKYPDDADLATLFAESLMDQHPWDLWEKDGRAKPWTPEIIAALERSMRTFPKHFGAHHLYIHAVEASRTPERGLASATFLGDAVPGSGHLTHMPSHIYIRTGRYHEGVLANQRSVSVDSGYTAMCHAQGIYPLAYFPHNIHFLSSCAALEGNGALAWKTAMDLRAQLARSLLSDPSWSTLQHYWAYPYFVGVQLGLWEELRSEPMPDSSWKYATALWHYGQGMLELHEGKMGEARGHLEKMRMLAKDSAVVSLSIWYLNPATRILAIADGVLEGEILAREGKRDEAIARLRAATAHEDSLLYQEPPDWNFPSRHHLGAVLLNAGRYNEAMEAYQHSLLQLPENCFALIGLQQALVNAGRREEAAAVAGRLKSATHYADRPITLSRPM